MVNTKDENRKELIGENKAAIAIINADPKLLSLSGITITKEKPDLTADKDIDRLGAMFVSVSETAELMGTALSAGRVPLALEATGDSQPLPEEMRQPKAEGKKSYKGFIFFRDNKKTTAQQSFYFRLPAVLSAGGNS